MQYRHVENVSVRAIYDEGDAGYRYRLEITRSDAPPHPRTVCVVMQNPSVAGEQFADKSVQFLEKVVFNRGLAEFEGVDRLVIVNQFARVQTTGFAGLETDIGRQNDDSIRHALQEADLVVVGWGASNRFHGRQAFVHGLMKSLCRAKPLYQTRMHPSRGRCGGFIQPLVLP